MLGRIAVVGLVLAGCRARADRHRSDLEEARHGPLCRAEATAPPPAFARDLRAWADHLTDSDNRYYGELSWRALEALGDSDLGPPEEEQSTRIVRGWDRIRFGDLGGAVRDFEAAEALGDPTGTGLQDRARQLLGAAWMREAETVSCVAAGPGQSCIVPFGPHSIHLDPAMMTAASGAFERALASDPDQPSVQWLDNVAYMAQGRWPGSVPAEWQLPEGFLDPDADAPTWTNVLPDLGIVEPTLAGGAALEDFDGDGQLDLLVSTVDPWDGMDLFVNQGGDGFCTASNASGVSSIPGLLSFSVVDYDNDGDMDVFGARGGWMGPEGSVRPSLLRNDGHGHFEDVAVEAGFDDPEVNGPTQVGAWGDVDGDGWLDVFVGRESEPDAPRVSSLYLARGDGTFVDVAAEAGLRQVGFVKGATWIDYDRDGDLDLYVSVFKGDNALFENLGDGTFVDRARDFGLVRPDRSFSVAALDYDQDGRQDLFAAAFNNDYAGGGPLDPTYFRSIESWVLDRMGLPPKPDVAAETARLYHNTPEGFVDVTRAMGLDDIHSTMGMSFGDFDVDSFPDLLLGTGGPEFDALEPKAAYRDEGGVRFDDVTTAMGMGSIQKGHGVSFGDIDEDGDEDLLLELGGAFLVDSAPNQLFVNPTNGPDHQARHAVTLRLEGVTVNRSALQARVRVVTADRSLWQVVGESGSFGNSSTQLEFGLGDADAVEAVQVDWPGAETEVVEDVPVDSIVTIRQGEGVVDARPYAMYALDPGGPLVAVPTRQ